MSWQTLQEAYPWPNTRPERDPLVHGWVVRDAGWRAVLDGIADPVVFEVGAWTGKTSLWLLENYPALRLIGCDLWKPVGALADQIRAWRRDGHMRAGESLANVYTRNLWDYRDRVVIVPGCSTGGMQAVAQHVQPHVVFIDADHSYDSVCADIHWALAWFPHSVICGDDYEDRTPPVNGVRQAVHEYADANGLGVVTEGRFWRYV